MKKLWMILRTWYVNKYSFGYIIDALTGRRLKYRKGKCNKCGKCCRMRKDLSYCKHIDKKTKKCKIYNLRGAFSLYCNNMFPVSQEELNHFKKIFKDFKCGYSFKKY